MRPYFLKTSFIIAALAFPAVLFAADPAPTPDRDAFSFNAVLVGLVSLIIVLLFVIGVAANVLRQLSFVYREKMRAAKTEKTSGSSTSIITGLLLLMAICLPAFSALAADGDAAAPVVAPVSKFINGIPKDDYYAILAIIILELLVLTVLLVNIRILVRVLSARPETERIAKAIVRRSFWERFNKSVALDKEKDITLDHDYDGIQELDNSLPPWWKYGFYATIIVSIVYLWYYHASGQGPSSYDEYVASVEKGKEEVAAYLATSANNVDENTVTVITDKGQLDAAKNIFETTCSACHAKDGGGGIGPNLTDDHWLHGGGIKDIFKSIKYGWQDKGMKSWKDDYSPKQIAELASYIKSLQGSKPANPKDPQGDLYVEGKTAAPAATTDSTKAN
ncbi:cbb3-type cytochrome c oxidase N-terminal domain-containing protein [Taibaiella soli]|nr:cbb3-type cytochrome c oxidase N-terminal domain-containing protein [Taibaiella soli]